MSSVLLLSNQDVEKLLTIEDTIRALDEAYLELDKGQTANRPRTFTFSPTNTGRFVANTHADKVFVGHDVAGRCNQTHME